MMNWLRRLLYKWSGHNAQTDSWEHEIALRKMRDLFIEVGRKQAPQPVISQGTCPKHPLVLLNNMGHGDYCCMMCKEEERTTGPIQRPRMLTLYNDARHTGASPHTAIQKAVHLTQNLSKLKEQSQ